MSMFNLKKLRPAKFILTIIMLAAIHTTVFGQSTISRRDITYPDFKTAALAPDKIMFKLKSTKFGMITSGVDGYVLAFKALANVDWKNSKLSDMKLEFSGKSMDTDNDSRNEKMWDDCLNIKETPEINVAISGEISFANTESQAVNGFIWIRNKTFPIPVTLQFTPDENGLLVKGSAKLSIKALEIPDPSIMIAKMDDNIDIELQFHMPK